MRSIVIVLSAICVSAHAQLFLGGLIHLPNTNIDSPKPDASSTYTKPAFCKDLGCPRFTVLESNDKFEVRRYEPSVWVAIKQPFMLYTEAESHGMFDKLFHYISGNNSAAMKIDMTAPVLTEIEHGQGPDCESNFTMHFMMPFSLHANPPVPTESPVFIRRIPAKTVIVKSYGGFTSDTIRRQMLEEFVGDLDAANKMYEDRIFYTAGYDGPFKFTNRHNEIWVVAK